MRVVFLGSGAFGVPGLEALARSRHDVALVVSQPDRPAGREKVPAPPPAAAAARRLGLPLFQPERINTAAARARVAEPAPDVLVVAAYGQILRRKVLDLPRLCCVNVHGSLLPRHRGASCIAAAILAGDRETGVTIMVMDEGLDTGPVLRRVRTDVARRETAGALHDRLAGLAPAPLLAALDDLEAGRARPEPQEESRATTCALLSKDDGRLDWSRPAAELDRRIRAVTPWPGAFTFLPRGRGGALRLIVEEAAPAAAEPAVPGTVVVAGEGRLVVAAGSGALEILRVRPSGRGSMGASAFLAGYGVAPGARLQDAP